MFKDINPSFYNTNYEKLFAHLNIDMSLVNHIIEVGTCFGHGAYKLNKMFPYANIETMDMPQPFDDYDINVSELKNELNSFCTYYSIKSPPTFPWPKKYDYCSIDITSKAIDNIASFKYWIKYRNPNGILSMVIPKSNEIKKEQRNIFEKYLLDKGHSFTKFHEFYIFQ